MAYLVGVTVVLLAVAVSLFLVKAEKMSDAKQALCVTGAALTVFVVLIALFGAFYESPF